MATATEPKVRAHGTIRVSLPAKIAYNPDALKKIAGAVAERLGCTRCFSGANCFFKLSEFRDRSGGGLAVALNPQPLPPRGNHSDGRGSSASVMTSTRY